VRVTIEDLVTGRAKDAEFDTLPRVGDMVQMKGGPWAVAEVVHTADADGDYTNAIVRITQS
jgi:hypothetical protein